MRLTRIIRERTKRESRYPPVCGRVASSTSGEGHVSNTAPAARRPAIACARRDSPTGRYQNNLRLSVSIRTCTPLTGWIVLCVVAAAQEPLPVPAPMASSILELPSTALQMLDAVADEPPTGEQLADPLVACLRIPASMLTEEASRSFQHTSPVDRVVLGTHARGTADCRGQIRCEMGQQPNTVELVCHISGTVRSITCGTNGPAVINSTAETSYTAVKSIVFDGRQLTTQPVVVNASTRVQITGIGSSVPRIRGRIVQRVATRRAAESRLEAERVTCQLTVDELQQHIDAEFSQRIVSLNRKLAMRLTILDVFADNKYELSISSRPEYIQIVFARKDTLSHTANPLPNFPLVDKVALWIPLPNSPSPTKEGDQEALAWGFDDVKELLPLWLLASVSGIKDKIDANTPRLDLIRHSNWIGFQFDPERS